MKKRKQNRFHERAPAAIVDISERKMAAAVEATTRGTSQLRDMILYIINTYTLASWKLLYDPIQNK